MLLGNDCQAAGVVCYLSDGSKFVQLVDFFGESLGGLIETMIDHDFVRLEHSVETFQITPNAELAVIPDAGHFVLYADQQKVMPAIVAFFEAPTENIPFATTKSGYHPGETR